MWTSVQGKLSLESSCEAGKRDSFCEFKFNSSSKFKNIKGGEYQSLLKLQRSYSEPSINENKKRF